MNKTVLVVDDDTEMRSLVEDHLLSLDLKVLSFESSVQAHKHLVSLADSKNVSTPPVDLILSDIQMPELDGLQFLRKCKEICPNVPVVLITAYGSVDSAVQALRAGAYDYLTKPFKLAELSHVVNKALEVVRLKKENNLLRLQIKEGDWNNSLIGRSVAMKEVFALLEPMAKASSHVLIQGESGTGKELVAKALHKNGPRSGQAFVAVNCSAIPDELLESELFGHAKGAFTGAIQKKKGLFEVAHGGTLFLDEIGDLGLHLQAKLLRAVQEKCIRPIGEVQDIPIDVRIIAATHKNLHRAIKNGVFREDLYYRLSVLPINLPPLRARREDIPLLVEQFLAMACARNGVDEKKISADAMAYLVNSNWPGNVRELENLIERLVVLIPKSVIAASDLPENIKRNSSEDSNEFSMHLPHGGLQTLEQLERRYIAWVLNYTGNKKEKAAQILGVNRRTLYRKECDDQGVTGFSNPTPEV